MHDLTNRAVLLVCAAALSLGGCASDEPDTAPPDTVPPDTAPPGTPPPAPRVPTIASDAMGCLDVDGHRYTSMRLEGRLVVTYYERSIEERLCDWDEESTQYWCPSPTMDAPECADVGGTFWCPTATPSPDRLGDPQELGIFDLANPSAGVRRWTTNLVHEAEIDVSPDGTRVIYAVRDKMDAFEQGHGIWMIDIDGSNPRSIVTQEGFSGIPTWNGNDRFTFIGDSFHSVDIATGAITNIAVTGFDDFLIDPEASHDGSRVVFKADLAGDNRPTIHIMDFDGRQGSNVRQLTSGYSDHDPVFSADNRLVYFERYYGTGEWDQYDSVDRTDTPEINQWGIVEVSVESAEERVLIPHDPCGRHFWWLPTVSPDGRHLMFIHDFVDEESGYQDLWVSDLDGNNAQPVPGTNGFHWFDWTR